MQFSFAFSGKLHRVSISSGNRPRYTKCVSILSSKDSEHCSIEAFTAHRQLIHYISFVFICQELFQNFFEVFEAILSKLKLFWPPKPVCQELFSFFSSRFSARPPRLSATALIEYHSTPPPVNINFQFFSYFLKLVVFCFLCYNKYRTLRTKPQRCLYLP